MVFRLALMFFWGRLLNRLRPALLCADGEVVLWRFGPAICRPFDHYAFDSLSAKTMDAWPFYCGRMGMDVGVFMSLAIMRIDTQFVRTVRASGAYSVSIAKTGSGLFDVKIKDSSGSVYVRSAIETHFRDRTGQDRTGQSKMHICVPEKK